MINHFTRSKKWNMAFFKTNFETVQLVIQVNTVNYGKAARHNMFDQSHYGWPHQAWFSNNFRDTNRHPRGSIKKGSRQPHYKHSPRKLDLLLLWGTTHGQGLHQAYKGKVQEQTKGHMWPSITRIKSKTLHGGVTFLSTRHHLPKHQSLPTPWNRGNSYWKTCN